MRKYLDNNSCFAFKRNDIIKHGRTEIDEGVKKKTQQEMLYSYQLYHFSLSRFTLRCCSYVHSFLSNYFVPFSQTSFSFLWNSSVFVAFSHKKKFFLWYFYNTYVRKLFCISITRIARCAKGKQKKKRTLLNLRKE